MRGAFEVAITEKARAAPLDIRLLVETWGATVANAADMVQGSRLKEPEASAS